MRKSKKVSAKISALLLSAALVAAASVSLVGCAPAAKKIGRIESFTKSYFAGSAECSSAEIDLSEYVDANGTEVTYSAESDAPNVAEVAVNGDKLTVTMKSGEGDAKISVDVLSGGKKAFELNFTVTAAAIGKIACIGDSLTYGHAWHNESYPVYLQEMLGDGVTVQNFGINGGAVTSCRTQYNPHYSETTEYSSSLEAKADLVIFMLGTNDSFNWEKASETFREEYAAYLEAYLDNGAQNVVVMTSPPTLPNNRFEIPNEVVRDNICPIQREVAAEYGLPLLDLRNIFEAQDNLDQFYRSGDGVHLTVQGAQFVASRLTELFKTI